MGRKGDIIIELQQEKFREKFTVNLFVLCQAGFSRGHGQRFGQLSVQNPFL